MLVVKVLLMRWRCCIAETAKRYGVSERETVVVDPSGHIVWRGLPSNVKQIMASFQGDLAAARQLHAKTA